MTVRHDFQPCAPLSAASAPAETPAPARGGRVRGALLTGGALAVLWAGLHADDPASWAIGGPTIVLGAAIALILPPANVPRLSAAGALRFAEFVVVGIARGALDVAWRSLALSSLRPGLMVWHTTLPEGGARRLFALTITLLPGTLTARLDDATLVVHALDRGAATRADLEALEARVAGLFRVTDVGRRP